MMKKAMIFIGLLALLTIYSCHDDTVTNEDNVTTTIITPPATVYEEISGDVIGYVYDESGQPLEGVNIQVYSASTTTDEYGLYRFENIKLDRQGTYIMAQKPGFIFGSDMIYPNTESQSVSYIQLMKLDETGSFQAENGGTIAVEGGGSIVFDPGSIVDESGNNYNGMVIVTAKHLATDDPKIGDKMPGALRATDGEGRSIVLGTLGMMAVELRDDQGKELNLKQDYTAEITFPISAVDQNTAPDEIPLWSFNESSGLWIEEGKAVREGNTYIGRVSHFSYWNCDAPFPLIQLCGQVSFSNGEPASWIKAQVAVDGLGTRFGWTDSDGVFCGKMPYGEELTISFILPTCDTPIETITVGPFYSDTYKEDIVIEIEFDLLIAQVVCNNDPVSDATVIVDNGLDRAIYPIDSDGKVYASSELFECSENNSFTIFAIDNGTNEASPTFTRLENDPNLLILDVCSDCTFEVVLENTDNDLCDAQAGILFLSISGGSGNYTYSWTNGETGSGTIDSLELNPNFEGQFCVTVTDVADGCEKIECVSVTESSNFVVQADVRDATCDNNNGSITLFPDGGAGTLSFVWDLRDGSQSTSMNLTNISEGTYMVTITDENGCTWTESYTIEGTEGLGGISIQAWEGCFEATLSVDIPAGTGPFDVVWDNGLTDFNITVFDSGTYCVTVSDANGCSESECIDVDVLPFIPMDNDKECDQNFITYTNVVPGYFYDFFAQGYPGLSIEATNTSLVIDIRDVGYDYWVRQYDPNHPWQGECGDEIFETLPKFSGLSVEEASGGIIVAGVDEMANCRDCTYGEVAIYSENDLTNNLAMGLEATGLPQGEYYVVALDDNTGCWIAHEKVFLQ